MMGVGVGVGVGELQLCSRWHCPTVRVISCPEKFEWYAESRSVHAPTAELQTEQYMCDKT